MAEPYVYCLLEAGVPASLGRFGLDSAGSGAVVGEELRFSSDSEVANLLEVRRETALGGMLMEFVVVEQRSAGKTRQANATRRTRGRPEGHSI